MVIAQNFISSSLGTENYYHKTWRNHGILIIKLTEMKRPKELFLMNAQKSLKRITFDECVQKIIDFVLKDAIKID